MRSPHCNDKTETVVWCHSNFAVHGKAVHLKAHDIFGFFGCSGCHEWFDTTRDEARLWYFALANARSLLRLIEKGIVKIEGMKDGR